MVCKPIVICLVCGRFLQRLARVAALTSFGILCRPASRDLAGSRVAGPPAAAAGASCGGVR